MAFEILDQLSVGIVLIDRCARVVFANGAARSMTTDDGPFRLNRRLIGAISAPSLDGFIRSAVDRRSGGAISLSAPDGRPLMVIVSPMRSRSAELGSSEGNGTHSVAAMVTLCDPDLPTRVPPVWLMDAYGMTLAEARVAFAASSGVKISDMARLLEVSPNTVKTHLRRVYEKTGVRRQAELARLMAMIGLTRDVAG
jgi:DNA-binding CsgD family transcriptional regulator